MGCRSFLRVGVSEGVVTAVAEKTERRLKRRGARRVPAQKADVKTTSAFCAARVSRSDGQLCRQRAREYASITSPSVAIRDFRWIAVAQPVAQQGEHLANGHRGDCQPAARRNEMEQTPRRSTHKTGSGRGTDRKVGHLPICAAHGPQRVKPVRDDADKRALADVRVDAAEEARAFADVAARVQRAGFDEKGHVSQPARHHGSFDA